eukprot:1810-Pelagococcus_subviridis.AAC.1
MKCSRRAISFARASRFARSAPSIALAGRNPLLKSFASRSASVRPRVLHSRAARSVAVPPALSPAAFNAAVTPGWS